jgi:hypothetical protein
MKGYEMGETCSRRGRYEICIQDFNGKDHMRDLGVDGRVILKWICVGCGGVGWIIFGSG